MTESSERTTRFEFLAGGGEMGALMRSLDWSRTPLGPVDGWPQSLRSAVSICLGSRFPILIWWGRDLVMLYNDAYRPILGATKHPRAMGQIGRECWPEIWPIIGPMLENTVLARGEATQSDDELLVLDRNGYLEECYFTFSYSPIRDESGGIGGVFCAATETTARVLAERRLRLLRLLATSAADTRDAEEACRHAAAALAADNADVPFALIYLLDRDRSTARLTAAAGLPEGTPASPLEIDLTAAGTPWPLGDVARDGTPRLTTGLRTSYPELPGGPWPVSPDAALVVPISGAGHDHPAGFLVAGISPRRWFDEDHRDFVLLVAAHIGMAITDAAALGSTALGAITYVEEALRWLPDTGPAALGPASADTLDSATVSGPPAAPAPDSATAGVEPRRARVLWADDNADMRDYVRRLLGRHYDVEAVADGSTALDVARQRPPDLVLADVMMPGLDGFALLQALRADERLRTVPVIMLSARADEEARVEGLRAGADDYVVKPFSARELLARVEAHLKLQRVRRDAQAALLASEAKFSTAFDESPLVLTITSLDSGRLVEVNEAFVRLGGYTRAEALGRTPDELGLWVEPTLRAERFARLRVGERVPTIEARFRTKRGEVLTGLISSAVVAIDGRPCVLSSITDITERKRAEEALQAADRAKDEFLAMLGHELRNPLGALASAARLLDLEGRTPEMAARARGVISRQLDHLTRLVDDLLDVSRVTTAKVRLSRRPLDLAHAARGAVDTLRARGPMERHQVTFEGHPVWIDADETRIEQIVTNLVGNAIKFTPPGGTITVTVGREGLDAVLAVRDTGVGIPAETLPRIFDLFVQGERSLDRPQGGLGIGLTLVRRLVELHGGIVQAASEGKGKGSLFTVRLPAIHAPAANTPAMPAAPAESHPRRVLIVEDNDDAREMLRTLLARHGHEVHEAADGPSGLDAALTLQPDIALVDVGLPGLDGYAVARGIRARPEGRGVLLVALTGYGQPEDRRRAREAGFDAHLVKPVDLAQLVPWLARSGRAHTGRQGADLSQTTD